MTTTKKNPGASEGARRATGEAPGTARPDTGRFSSRRKTQAVLRLLRGEDLDRLSRDLGVTAARLVEWRDAFLAAGQTGLQERDGDPREEENRRLKALIGDLTMRNEILRERARALEAGLPLARRRPRR